MKKTRNRGLLSLFICVLLVLVLAFSLASAAIHSDHDCTEHDCTICAAINHIAQNMSQLFAKSGFVFGFMAVLFLFVFTRTESRASFSPVLLKTRLDC